MPRPRIRTSDITKYRMNKGWHTPALSEAANISDASIRRIEESQEVLRVVVAKYLRVLGIDLNNPATLPANWVILDRGEKVILKVILSIKQ